MNEWESTVILRELDSTHRMPQPYQNPPTTFAAKSEPAQEPPTAFKPSSTSFPFLNQLGSGPCMNLLCA